MKKALIAMLILVGGVCHADPILVKEQDGKVYRKEEVQVDTLEVELRERRDALTQKLQFVQDQERIILEAIAQVEKDLVDLDATKK